jgi:hypothetical protein
MQVKGDKMEADPKCPVCNGPAYADERVPFDVIKHVNASGAKQFQRFLCGPCAEREAKRQARVERERIAATAVAKAMRGG